MARPIEIQWNVSAVDKKIRHRFTAATERSLLRSLAAPPEKSGAALAALRDIAAMYRRQRRQDALSDKGAAVNRALAMVETQARVVAGAPDPVQARLDLDATLALLNQEAEWPLFLAWRRLRLARGNARRRLAPDYDPEEDDGAFDWRTYSALEIAEAAVKARLPLVGRPANTTLNLAVALLVNVWEDAGRQATSNPYDKTRYTGLPQTDCGKFIVEFFRTVDDKVTDTSISHPLRMAIRRRAAAKSGHDAALVHLNY